ncbi:Rab GDP dissociation inhibitor [Enteropsectra breve]|nr:Rab GDP dissociation inhibitor [Enteropsectra breve]
MENSGSEALDEYYDYVILGTGLTETIISSILAQEQKYKILHIDTNTAYGSDFASLQYLQLEKHFGGTGQIVQELKEKSSEFNVDLTPKLILQDSKLRDFLVKNNVHDIVEFTAVKGSFICTNRMHKIPRNEAQALTSSVVSLFQKPKVIKFFWNCRKFGEDPESFKAKPTMEEEFQRYSLNDDSIDFIGHAIALNLNDEYLKMDPRFTYENIVKYVSSIACYENSESPYIYPVYGLSELCQAFARRSACYGSLFMLGAKLESIEKNKVSLVDPDGKRQTVKAGKIISDPKYFKDSVVVKQIIRCILIIRKNEEMESSCIMFYKKYLKRKNDIFCVILGAEEKACPAGYCVVILSTVKETEDPEKEISQALRHFDILKKYIELRDVHINSDSESVIFTRGVDESAVMENIYKDVERIAMMLGIEIK